MILLKYGSLNGESKIAGYEKWIVVSSMQFGVGRGIQASAGGATRQASTPSVSEVTFSKEISIDSNDLCRQSFSGKGAKAEIHIINTQEDKNKCYFKIELDDAMVSSYSVSSGGDRPNESFSLNFAKIMLQYDQWDGVKSVAAGTPAKWDLSNNKPY